MICVPLSKLKVMPRVGSPAIYDDQPWTIAGMLDNEVWIVASDGSGRTRYVDIVHVALDLSEPITARIDGATVAATMLAEKAELNVSQGVTWEASRGTEDVRVSISARDPVGYPAAALFPRWPAVVFSDATEPREILAAVLLAALGVKS